MIKVKGTAVSKWVKSKLWFSLNSDTIMSIAGVALFLVVGYVLLVVIMAVTPN